jgi:methylenetetrahydrofolate dehydrogenase (NADP+)/methenyltetrahydrofolate cyclohydrolase
MNERIIENKVSATPSQITQSSSSLLSQRSLNEELPESLGSNSNISKKLGGIQPKTIRCRLNWQNITVEAPSRLGASSAYTGVIQRQQTSDAEGQQESTEPLQTQSESEIESLRGSESEQQGEGYKNKLNESIFNDVIESVKLYGKNIKDDVTEEYQKEEYLEKIKDKPNKKVVIIKFEVPEDQNHPNWSRLMASEISANVKATTFTNMNLEPIITTFSRFVKQEEFANYIDKKNKDNKVCAIIVQTPVPRQLLPILKNITLRKDIDGLSKIKKKRYNTPATSEGIVRLIEPFYQSGQKVAVVGGKGFVGRGVVRLLKNKGIETQVFDKDDNLMDIKEYDIVVSTVGQVGIIESKHLKKEHILVVDTGFIPQKSEKGKKPDVAGDVEKSAQKIPKHITPVPGGIGPIEMAILMERVAKVLNVQVKSWKVKLENGKLKAVFVP